MRYANSKTNINSFGGFVNGLAVMATVILVGAGYISALGSFAGAAYCRNWCYGHRQGCLRPPPPPAFTLWPSPRLATARRRATLMAAGKAAKGRSVWLRFFKKQRDLH